MIFPNKLTIISYNIFDSAKENNVNWYTFQSKYSNFAVYYVVNVQSTNILFNLKEFTNQINNMDF